MGWEALAQWGDDVARIERLAGGRIDTAPLVDAIYPMERFEDAFRLMGEADGVAGRILLEHT